MVKLKSEKFEVRTKSIPTLNIDQVGCAVIQLFAMMYSNISFNISWFPFDFCSSTHIFLGSGNLLGFLIFFVSKTTFITCQRYIHDLHILKYRLNAQNFNLKKVQKSGISG